MSSSTSHSGDRLYQSGTLKSTNDNLNVPSYRRKYISNKKPGIKPASHFTERCKSSAAPACRTRSLHYLTPKVKRMIHCILNADFFYCVLQLPRQYLYWNHIFQHGVSFGDLQFTSSQTISQKNSPSNVSRTLPRSLRYRSFNNDLRVAPKRSSQISPCSKDNFDAISSPKSCSSGSVDFHKSFQSTDLVPDFTLG